MSKRIIIDTDPGIDDTFAIFLALRSPELEVVGITSIFGNTDIDHTTENCLRLIETAGFPHIPVAKGCGVPLIMPMPRLGTMVHGSDGMGNTNLHPPTGKPVNIPAAQFIVETILANPGEITLVPIGPLTNIALALRLEPRIAQLVKELVIMGGAANGKGNASPVSEANIFHDPHAAAVVFSAGWPVTMVGLDVTTQVVMTSSYLRELTSSGSPCTDLIGKIIPAYQNFYQNHMKSPGSIQTHDPSAIAYVINPDYFQTISVPVYVETQGYCSGQTIPDHRHQWGDTSPINICVNVDPPPLLEMIKERLTC